MSNQNVQQIYAESVSSVMGLNDTLTATVKAHTNKWKPNVGFFETHSTHYESFRGQYVDHQGEKNNDADALQAISKTGTQYQ